MPSGHDISFYHGHSSFSPGPSSSTHQSRNRWMLLKDSGKSKKLLNFLQHFWQMTLYASHILNLTSRPFACCIFTNTCIFRIYNTSEKSAPMIPTWTRRGSCSIVSSECVHPLQALSEYSDLHSTNQAHRKSTLPSYHLTHHRPHLGTSVNAKILPSLQPPLANVPWKLQLQLFRRQP